MVCRGSLHQDPSCVSDPTQDPSRLGQVWGGSQKREGGFTCCHELSIWRLVGRGGRVVVTRPTFAGAEKEETDSGWRAGFCAEGNQNCPVFSGQNGCPLWELDLRSQKHRGPSELPGKSVLFPSL